MDVASKNISASCWLIAIMKGLGVIPQLVEVLLSYCYKVLFNPLALGTLVSACVSSSSLSKNQLYWICLSSCQHCVLSHLK